MTTNIAAAPPRSLEGRIALVSGGSRGIGLTTAQALAEAGATVVATSRHEDEAKALARTFGSVACVLDVLDTTSVSSAVERVTAELGPVTVLVNNAGVNDPEPFLNASIDNWDRIHATNARGAFLLSQEVARVLVARELGGTIVSVASQAGLVAIEERAVYCASKAALIALTKVMAIELAPHQINANCVAPTFVPTELARQTLDRPEIRERFLHRIPAGHFAETEDVAAAISYLASPAARMVTGHTLVVDGGWTAW